MSISRTAEELFRADGPIARALGRYESRNGQIEMAGAVFRALDEERILLCEAGTGTGKTLAYLVPSLLSGKKIVISTATRALQEQIVNKDLPLAARALGVTPKIALMKGLSNYICRRRLAERLREPADVKQGKLSGGGRSRALAMVESWVKETEVGDIALLSGVAEDHPIFSEVTASADTRVGAACAYYQDCFVTRMKRASEQADIVVVNHHLFFADLALRGPHPGRVIPDYDAVIFDEAHQIEDIATNFFGSAISNTSLERLIRDFERAFGTLKEKQPELGPIPLVSDLRHQAQAFFELQKARVPFSESKVTLEPGDWSKEDVDLWHGLDAALEALSLEAELFANKAREVEAPLALSESLSAIGRRAFATRQSLGAVIEGASMHVTWAELNHETVKLSSTPVELKDLLRERLFESVPSVIFTSATLCTEGRESLSPFDYFRRRLGIDEELSPLELRVASPFAFEKCALLYLPKGLPEPSSASFLPAAAGVVEQLVRASGGGAFVLCTSLKSMRWMHATLAPRLEGFPVWVQGQKPKSALLEDFSSVNNAVLIATHSFWQGVDVPGSQLRLVILEKLPFAVPSEPLLKARSKLLEEEGESPFMGLFVPLAAITLKQGFGRLIRSESDQGVVALLDSRAVTRSYGRRLLGALPPARQVRDLEEVESFFRTMGCLKPNDH